MRFIKFNGLLLAISLLATINLLGQIQYQRLDRSEHKARLSEKRERVFNESELDNTIIDVTLVFKANGKIPSDDVLKQTMPLKKHVGPFGRQISGTAREIVKLFKLDGFEYWKEDNQRIFHAHLGPISLPADWASQVLAVLGLVNRTAAKRIGTTRINRNQKASANPELQPLPKGWPPLGFFPQDIAKLYNFPEGDFGNGQTIGIVELTLDEPGQTTGIIPEELRKYFIEIGLTPPVIEIISVDGAKNQPTVPFSNDGEASLDVCLAGGIANKAKIQVFFAPNTAQGFYNCFATMLSAPYNVPVSSCSWGSFEIDPTQNANVQIAFEELFASVTDRSTICTFAGDGGSTDEFEFAGPGTAQPLFPPNCPHVLSVGGTTLIPNSNNTKVLFESTWNWGGGNSASGGGVSSIFDVPEYQSKTGIKMRSVNNGKRGRAYPDVCIFADPFPGFNIRIDQFNVNKIGGTSAAAPLWAGLIARLNVVNGGKPLGFVNPLFYANPKAFRKVECGSVGQYFASRKFNAATGLGAFSKKLTAVIQKNHKKRD